MTTAELLAVLARECPNGVSFDPMSVRLLRKRQTNPIFSQPSFDVIMSPA
jgi:hypothetical protein